MDALALLCNLHADGPFTLQRLRRAGCDSLAALLEVDAGVLGQHVDGGERGAERFLREAQVLAERLEGEVEADFEDVDLEDEPEQDELPLDVDEEEGEDEDLESDEPIEESWHAAEVDEVLATWRDRDREEPPEEPRDFVVPRPEWTPAQNPPLDQLHLDGVEAGLAHRLAEHGVITLKGLVESSPLELARDLGVGFTRVKHIQFLAQREAERRLSAEEERIEADRESEVPLFDPPTPHRMEASGPFAGDSGVRGD